MITTFLRRLDRKTYDDYQRDGFMILRGFLAPGEADAIRSAFLAAGADGPVQGLSDMHAVGRNGDPLARWPRMMHPHRHPELPAGVLALRCLLDLRLRDVLWDLLGEEPIAAQSMYYFKPPGARGQDFHQDNFYLRVAPGTCLAAWFAIDRADPENGGLSVVPGSHRLDLVCPGAADETLSFAQEHVDIPAGMAAVPTILEPGDVLLFNGSVIHGSRPNTSDRFRGSLICHYLPRSSTHLSHWYRPAYAFDGREVTFADAVGGGPCGGVAPGGGPH